ncbi:patatin-like phospholipase family protein [soil metagenome]
MSLSDSALDWVAVLEGEYEALYGVKPFDGTGPSDRVERLKALHLLMHQRRPSALCLSGGGIRSATFGLGVLQALARTGILGKLDYLSTVSGGGYIGGWLTTWLHREGRSDVIKGLDPAFASALGGEAARLSPVDRLRATCRYLAPQGGLVSADVWTLLATMGRNLLLNWLVLLPLLAAVLLIPRLYLAIVQVIERNDMVPPGDACMPADAAPFWLFLVSLSMFVVALGYVVMNFVGRGERWSQGRFVSFVVAPTVVGAVTLTLFWSAYPCAPSESAALVVSAILPAAAWMVIGTLSRQTPGQTLASGSQRAVRMSNGLRTVLAALIAGPIVGFGAYWFAHKYFYFGDPLGPTYAVFAVPAILGLTLLSNTTFLGIASGELSDAALEWWNRLAAWIAIAGALWLAAGVLVFYLADLVEATVQAVSAALQLEHRTASAIFSVLVPLLSSLAGFASRQGTAPGRPSQRRLAAQRLALPFIIVVLLATVAWFNAWALRGFTHPDDGAARTGPQEVLLFGVFLLGLGLLVSRFVPVNRFSLNGMYRQRLIRTFLGASHRERQPNAFTGFDPADDLRVHELKDVRPLQVINATLNNVASTELGRHERKAYAFTFSPLHVGSAELGYRRSPEYGSDGGSPGTGLSLGSALAVSGAAASPAMGIYSSKARAFLLTLANARLGLWFGNPTDPVTWRKSDPTLGVGPLIRELLGLTSDVNPYVYLSDGGHFENLGLWSMVARRCRVIVVSDAGCDPEYTFADLSNAVRRIRIDMGIPIEFNDLDMTRAGQGRSNPHGVLGRIRYRAVDGEGVADGWLLYVKATLSGDESVDVRNFAALDPAFPHDSTSQQFFGEDRFESYRALGYHSIMSLSGGLDNADAWDLCAAVERASGTAESVATVRATRV